MLRASAPVDSVVSGVNQAIPQVADVFGVDTSAADTVFVNAASIILPAWGAIVGAIFVFGTIAKIAFPDKYDAAVYKGKAEELVADEIIDLDNLSPEDMAAVEALEAEKAVVAKQLEDTKVAQIKAEAVRDANSEVILMLKKELESTKDELREMKSNSVSEKEFTAMQSELDRAWEAAAELQTMWDNDRKVIEFLTKSSDDEKVKKEARQGLNIPVAAKGLLSWARTTISKRANDVSVVSQQTLETVSQAYQELDASTGEFSDDVISDDSESDFMRDM